MKTISEYERAIRQSMQKAGRSTAALGGQITSLAGALRTLAVANADIDSLETTVVKETTMHGSRVVPHPAFRVQRDAQASITKQMQVLGLTYEQLQGVTSSDPLVALTEKLANTRGQGRVVRPDPTAP